MLGLGLGSMIGRQSGTSVGWECIIIDLRHAGTKAFPRGRAERIAALMLPRKECWAGYSVMQ